MAHLSIHGDQVNIMKNYKGRLLYVMNTTHSTHGTRSIYFYICAHCFITGALFYHGLTPYSLPFTICMYGNIIYHTSTYLLLHTYYIIIRKEVVNSEGGFRR